MKLTSAADHGYVSIDLLLSFPKLRGLTEDKKVVTEAVKNSAYLTLSDDGEKIRRRNHYRLPDTNSNDDFSRNMSYASMSFKIASSRLLISNFAFLRALVMNKYIAAKQLLRTETFGVRERDIAERTVLERVLGKINNADLKSILLCKSIYGVFYNGTIDHSAVILIWAAFPRLLLAYPDIIHPPSMFQRSDWKSNWLLTLKEVETGAKKLDDRTIQVFDSIKENFVYSFKYILCEINEVSGEGALLLANVLCTNPRLILVHDSGTVILGSGRVVRRDSAPTHRAKNIKRVYMMNPTNCVAKQDGAEKGDNKESPLRIATQEEMEYLRQLRLSVPFPVCCHVNWEFYCYELLEILETTGPTTATTVELKNVDYSLPAGDLCKVDGVNAQEARLLASALCNSKIILVHDNVSTVWIKDISFSGPSITDSRRTTYRMLPVEESDSATNSTPLSKMRGMTETEVAYLRQLRWQDRRPALLLAARFRHGAYFHVLKLVALFL